MPQLGLWSGLSHQGGIPHFTLRLSAGSAALGMRGRHEGKDVHGRSEMAE